MSFNFDEIIDRSNTDAMAKDGFRPYLFAGQDPVVLPCPDDEAVSMWVADMAFASAPAAREAMAARIEGHPIFGYSGMFRTDLYDSFASWCDDRYGWRPDAEHFVLSPGIVPALHSFVELYLEPDDAVVTLTPSYGHFKHSTVDHGRRLVTCALIEGSDGRYSVDFDAFEDAVADASVRMFFLCHPHNPTGKVFTDDELRRLAELCFANDVLIISDEIHCDLLRSGLVHTPLAKLFPESGQIITCMSASKTFNLAGLSLANVIIPNVELRALWVEDANVLVNPLSAAATVGAFTGGHEWLTALREYLDTNMAYVQATLTERLPEAVFAIPDATYLAWVDLSAYFPAEVNLTRWFAEKAGVLLEGGDMFVADADGHVRLNVACPMATLVDGLDKVMAAVPNQA